MTRFIFVSALAASLPAAAQTARHGYADGTLTREEWKANPNAPIDCCYVAPTVVRAADRTRRAPSGPARAAVDPRVAT